MPLASACLGDMLLQLVRVTTIIGGRETSHDYQLRFEDLAQGDAPAAPPYTHSYGNRENDAILGFAAVLCADCEDLGDIQKYLDELKDSPAHRHLP